MSENTVAIGSDHAGYELKEFIKDSLRNSVQSMAFVDAGTHSTDSVDYPDYAHQVALKVEKGEVQKGILICGSGNGVCMAANKHQGIRASGLPCAGPKSWPCWRVSTMMPISFVSQPALFQKKPHSKW